MAQIFLCIGPITKVLLILFSSQINHGKQDLFRFSKKRTQKYFHWTYRLLRNHVPVEGLFKRLPVKYSSKAQAL